MVRGERADGVESRELRARAGGQAGSELSKGGRVGQNKERVGLLAERKRTAQKCRRVSGIKSKGTKHMWHGNNLLKSDKQTPTFYLK